MTALWQRLWRSRYLRESALYVGLQQVVQVAIGLFQVWALARYLPRDAYGIWGYTAAFAGMASIFTLPGVNQVVTYGAVHRQDGVLLAGLRLRLTFGLLATAALLIAAAVHHLSGREQAAVILLLAALFMPAQQAFDGIEAFLTGLGNFRALFWRRLAAQGSLAVGLWLGAANTGSVLVCAAILYGGGLLISAALFVWLLKLRRNRDLPENFKTMVQRFSLQSVGATISRSMERPVLSAFIGFHELAAYNLALTAQFPVSFGRLVERILISRLGGGRGGGAGRGGVTAGQIRQGMWLLFALGWPAWWALVLAVGYIVPWILPNYADAVPIIEILLLQAPFAWGAKPGLSWLLARTENHRWYHRIVWGIIVTRIVLISLGAWWAGIRGVAWAWVTVEALTFGAVMAVLMVVRGEAADGMGGSGHG